MLGAHNVSVSVGMYCGELVGSICGRAGVGKKYYQCSRCSLQYGVSVCVYVCMCIFSHGVQAIDHVTNLLSLCESESRSF